ncbi:hypothetical protein EDC04DRAFT_2893441 [Pisolithus marmoratus]|nr:hypothetical protein EDC04DRAFT_2909489 [Pisolithus marmoratus]KAI6041041.1 hypothetical protein EDC04DRAFT_2893441 [Pisolithus marmoratus]
MSAQSSPTVYLCENTILLEVDNILQDWPAYVINFTPENLGPVKLVLHFKKPSRYMEIDPNDDDPEITNKYRTMTMNKDAKIAVTMTPQSKSNMPPAVVTDAIPVELHGFPKQSASVPVKRKRFDSQDAQWPPPRPRALRKISYNTSIAQFDTLKTLPVPIVSIHDCDDNNAPTNASTHAANAPTACDVKIHELDELLQKLEVDKDM